jgi:hypothetical protein
MNVDTKYLEHLSLVDLSSAYCYKILMLLLIREYTQAQVSDLLKIQKQNTSKYFKELEHNHLIHRTRVEGKNIFFKAVTDVKMLKLNLPGQINILKIK